MYFPTGVVETAPSHQGGLEGGAARLLSPLESTRGEAIHVREGSGSTDPANTSR